MFGDSFRAGKPEEKCIHSNYSGCLRRHYNNGTTPLCGRCVRHLFVTIIINVRSTFKSRYVLVINVTFNYDIFLCVLITASSVIEITNMNLFNRKAKTLKVVNI